MKTKSLISILFLCGSLCVSAQASSPSKETKFPQAGAYKNTRLSYKIISSPNGTYGYDIYSDKQVIIHQPVVPGMPGNEGFKSKAGAQQIAQLVVSKIGKGQMPPTVSVEEMKKLKAIP